MKFNQGISHEELKEILNYDKETGLFTWKRTGRKTKKDRVAGCVNYYGYIQICVKGSRFIASRLAWFFVYGIWPVFYIDHINGIKTDNRIVNLRDVSQKINNQNRRIAYKNSKTGLMGVVKYHDKWKSHLCINGKNKSLGVFLTKEEAHNAYLEAKRNMHDGCTI